MFIKLQGIVQGFIYSAGILLLATAAAKLASIFGDVPILSGPDPIFGLSNRAVLSFAAAAEGVVGCICIRKGDVGIRVQSVAWLSTLLVGYRVGKHLLGQEGPCGCLGTITDVLRIAPGAADLALKVALAYLIAGSFLAMSLLGRMDSRENTMA
jgi:hypothetical protein